MKKSKLYYLIGKKFNRLTVIDVIIDNGRTRFVCKCDCGKITKPHACAVRSGQSKSCGCLISESNIKRNTTHGMTGTITHKSWINMINRCHTKSSTNYHKYGGIGISVCDKWRESFEQFYKDMGPRPSKKHSIDRIDNDGNYEPGNCRWATASMQILNRRFKSKSNTVGVTIIKTKTQGLSYIAALRIRKNGILKTLFCKTYKNIKDAEMAYYEARKKFHGF